jgi:hypothetical protein
MPKPGTPVQPPAVSLPPTKAPPEGRIDNLEKQLQQILKELEALRKEMKQPKPGGATEATPEELEKLRLKQLELEKFLREIERKDGLRFETKPDPKPMPTPESR